MFLFAGWQSLNHLEVTQELKVFGDLLSDELAASDNENALGSQHKRTSHENRLLSEPVGMAKREPPGRHRPEPPKASYADPDAQAVTGHLTEGGHI